MASFSDAAFDTGAFSDTAFDFGAVVVSGVEWSVYFKCTISDAPFAMAVRFAQNIQDNSVLLSDPDHAAFAVNIKDHVAFTTKIRNYIAARVVVAGAPTYE